MDSSEKSEIKVDNASSTIIGKKSNRNVGFFVTKRQYFSYITQKE